MKRILPTAVAAALLAGTAPFAIAPAVAQKKSEEAKAPGLKLSKEVRDPAAKAQAALAAKDLATAEPLVAQAEAAAKTEDDKYIAAALRLNVEVLKSQAPGGSVAGLKAPLQVLVANPRTPQADQARYNYQLGVFATNDKDNAAAATYFQRAQQLGYNDPNLPLQLVKLKMEGGDIAGGSAELEKVIDAQIAAGQKPDEQLFRYAISRTNQKRLAPQTYNWLKRYVATYPTAKTWRDAVVTYGLQPQGVATLDKGQKVDLYRLLRAAKALADQYDYEIYAQWAFDLGLPYETKAVLAEGKAAGKIPASSTNANDLLKAANTAISNEGSLATLEPRAKAAANGKLAASTGDAYLGSSNWAKAVEMYRLALQKGSVDADAVNTRLGIALANSGDKEGARAAFQAVKTPPRDGVAGLWIEYLDHPPTA